MELIESEHLGTAIFIVLLIATYACISVTSMFNKKEKMNFRNISQMAKNLAVCKVSTRVQVLRELYDDPEWKKEEVDELKSVLEGMLNTRLTIHKSGEKGLTARTSND